MKKLSYEKHEVSEEYLAKWQKAVDVMARIFEVPAGLIMRVEPTRIEVLVSSHTADNPYEPYEKADLGSGLYCETVMKTQKQLHVPNALDDEHWKDNPDVELNMICYLGIPLIWPDNQVFGTICVLDDKTRHFSKLYQDLLWELKEIIEADFRVIEHEKELKKRTKELEMFNKAMVDREMKIIELKKEVNRLCAELERDPVYTPIWDDK